jgi:hypothetical protein
MSWQGRMRELLLAGGTLAAAGCSNQQPVAPEEAGTSSSSSSGGIPCCNSTDDPCCTCGPPSTTPYCTCVHDGGVWHDWMDACAFPPSSDPCCLGNSDPCCPYMASEFPTVCQDVFYPACECEIDGGTWDDAGRTCVSTSDAGSIDGGIDATLPTDAGGGDAGDASLDVDAHD